MRIHPSLLTRCGAARGLACAIFTPCLFAAAPVGISGPAYADLVNRVNAPRNSFFIYLDADSGFNHGVASGVFGTIAKVHLNAACIDDPTSSNTTGCSSSQLALDQTRGTVFQIGIDPLATGESVGVNFEEPEGFSSRTGTVGYNLTGATRVVFDVRSPSPGGITVQFGIAGQTGGFVHIPQSPAYSSMSLPLAGIDVSNTQILFTVTTNVTNASSGGVILLDNIRLDPVPAAQTTALGMPLTYQTFGVVPVQGTVSARVPVPPDQLLRNLAAVYDSSLAEIALLRRGQPSDLTAARATIDSLDYLLSHDNHGDAIPPAPDGSEAFHDGYASGESRLQNSQLPPAQGLQGDAKLAGFSGGTNLCGSGGYCLVLDGGSTGSNAASVIALVAAYRVLQDQRYLNDARLVGKWILSMADTGAGYGGYFNGYDDTGTVPKTVDQGKSTETNALAFAAFTILADAEQELGNTQSASVWTSGAQTAGDFVIAMFNTTSGRFNAGAVPSTLPPGPGITPVGPTKGHDTINTFDFLDANTLPILTMAVSPQYQSQIDWRRPVQWILQSYPRSIQAGGRTYQGLNLVATTTAGPDGIAWEFTAQAVVAMRLVDRIYNQTQFESSADTYLVQIRQNQISAPYGDGNGLTASTLQNGDTIDPYDACLSTPFQCLPSRVAIAATAFAIFAEIESSPFAIAGRITPGGIVNAASFQPAPNNDISSGAIIAVFGAGMADTTAVATLASGALPTVQQGTALIINGSCAPIYFISPGQINAQVPVLNTGAQTVQAAIAKDISGSDCMSGNQSAPITVPVSTYSPGLLTFGQGMVLAQHGADSSLVQTSSPAHPDEVIVIYGVGFGPTAPAIVPGQIVNGTYNISATVTASIGGVALSSSDIQFAGLTPTLVGLYQFNLHIPGTVPTGTPTISVSVGGVSAQSGLSLPVAP